MVQIEGVKVTADMIKNLNDKRFVVSAKPFYSDIPDLQNKDKFIAKLIVPVSLCQDKTILDYIPNKKSIKAIVNLYGVETDKWVGMAFEWKVVEQDFLGMTKSVAYVKEVKVVL